MTNFKPTSSKLETHSDCSQMFWEHILFCPFFLTLHSWVSFKQLPILLSCGEKKTAEMGKCFFPPAFWYLLLKLPLLTLMLHYMSTQH